VTTIPPLGGNHRDPIAAPRSAQAEDRREAVAGSKRRRSIWTGLPVFRAEAPLSPELRGRKTKKPRGNRGAKTTGKTRE
jgi:hypothetical protein